MMTSFSYRRIQDFFFICGFRKFEYDVSEHGFLSVYTAWDFWSYLYLKMYVFKKFGIVLATISFFSPSYTSVICLENFFLH